MGVLHHHHLDSRESVRDAVLVFVAYGLKGKKEERVDEYREAKRGTKRQKKGPIGALQLSEGFHLKYTQELNLNMLLYNNQTSDLCSLIFTENNRYTEEWWGK